MQLKKNGQFIRNFISIFILLQTVGIACGQDNSFRYVTINDHQNEVIDLLEYASIFDDTFSVNYTFPAIQEQQFLPFKGFKVSRYHRNIASIMQWLKFGVENSGTDTLDAVFYAGKHHLLSIQAIGSPEIHFVGLTYFKDNKNKMFPDYDLPVRVAPKTKKIFYVQISNYGIVPDQITPRLYVGNSIKTEKNKLHSSWIGWLLFTSITMGGILVLGIFILAQYFSNRQREYLYYSGYALLVFLSLERSFEWNFGIRIISVYLPYYFVKAATLYTALSGIFYLLFVRSFLNIRLFMPRTDKFIQGLIAVLFLCISVLSLFLIAKITPYPVFVLSMVLSLIPITTTLIIMVLIWYYLRDNPLTKYVVWGYVFLFIGAGINIFINKFARHYMSDNYPLSVFLEIGVFLEIICFALGLGYKSRLAEKQKTAYELANLQLVFDHQLQIEKVRSGISRDLHDDIGSTLSSINILSQMAKHNAPESSDSKTTDALEKINERSQRLLDNMSDIVWSIKPENDAFDEMLSRMRQYATGMLESKGIDYVIDFPLEKLDFKLPLEVKNNIYLIFKEAVNNLCKYAECRQAQLIIRLENKTFTMHIQDDGIGFDSDTSINTTGGNGLKNMQARAAEIKAILEITSRPGKGTNIGLVMPL
jgi:signal transduction histidine kinase